MKPIVPSTRGLLHIVLNRTGAQQVIDRPDSIRFGSIQDRVNRMIKEWDCKDNPVRGVCITFTTTGDRSRNGQ